MLKPIFSRYLPKQVKNVAYSVLYGGDSFECPFCNSSFGILKMIGEPFEVLKKKEVIGAGKRRAGCWTCGSSDRERLVYLFLRDKLKTFEKHNANILHVAPEINLSKKLQKAKFKSYIQADRLDPGYKYGSHVLAIDVCKMPFEDAQFSLILCNHVLEHIPKDELAMTEMVRVLSDNGKAIIQVPLSYKLKSTYEDSDLITERQRQLAFGQEDHVRIYGKDYFERLQKAGFRVEKINISDLYPKAQLNPLEDLFICTKKKASSISA